VADGADDGDLRGEDGAGDFLGVEGLEIFKGTAAAREHQDLGELGMRVEIAEGVHDVGNRVAALDLDRGSELMRTPPKRLPRMRRKSV